MDKKPVIIFGAGGLGKAALEIFESNDIIVYGFLDDDAELHGKEINNIPILGRTEDDGFLKLIGKKCDAFIAVDDAKLKKSLTKLLNDRRKVMPINAHHQSANLAQYLNLGHGNFISSGTTLNSNVTLGNHCIINAGATLDYDVQLGDFVQVGTGAAIGAGCTIGDNCFIGAGSTLISGISIGKNARIGAGSVVIRDVDDGETLFGNPAESVKA